MFPTTYRRLVFTAVLMLLGLGAASAATVPWSQLPLRSAPNAWARTAGASRSPGSIGGRSASVLAPETILYAFKGIPDGEEPSGGLISDEDGSLYGTSQEGGLVFPAGNTLGAGTVFKLTPSRSGGYTESIIHRFGASGANDGWSPFVGGLAIDHKGALYGSTQDGGVLTCGPSGPGTGGDQCGTIFKLTPTAKGYTETILYEFQNSGDGFKPYGPPILDRSGALYGNTELSVYKLTPAGSGYKFSVLHTFGEAGPNDGSDPYGALLLDERTGDLYGTTTIGGINNAGIVFKLHPTASGYVYTIIYSFHGPDGNAPEAGLIMDRAGALYGTTAGGGPSGCDGFGCGVAFKLTPSSGGYTESVLHYFTGGVDGNCPESPLVADRFGTLYGITSCGGLSSYAGTVFKLVPTRTGYQEVTLHEFNPQTDGVQAGGQQGGVLLKGDYLLGELYGSGTPGTPDFNGAIFALRNPV